MKTISKEKLSEKLEVRRLGEIARIFTNRPKMDNVLADELIKVQNRYDKLTESLKIMK